MSFWYGERKVNEIDQTFLFVAIAATESAAQSLRSDS